jgi:hypothetical protein
LLLVSNNSEFRIYKIKWCGFILTKKPLEYPVQTRMRPEVSDNSYQDCVAGVWDATHV